MPHLNVCKVHRKDYDDRDVEFGYSSWIFGICVRYHQCMTSVVRFCDWSNCVLVCLS